MDTTANSQMKNSSKVELTQSQIEKQAQIIEQIRDQTYVPELSLLEQEYMEKAMQRQKDNIVKPQVVAGRTFKGISFISKPEAIIFKVSYIFLALTSSL